MCGIAGFLKNGRLSAEERGPELARMARALAHRGPDDQGIWHDARHGVGLCHRRLSIIDLSPLGHQPMQSASGRFTVTFNGEIYNYRELRSELLERGHAFRGASDTEVLLAALEEWKLEETLRRCSGMFAFALWDDSERTLHLARDRFGEKPLYYGQFGPFLLFGSELKALRRHSSWRAEVDRGALALLLRHGYVPAPHSIFHGVHKVRPGCVLSIRVANGGFSLQETEYWRPAPIIAAAPERNVDAFAAALVEDLHTALAAAVSRQMVADVPLGAFLSGGIDSSLIVALMQSLSTAPVRTFAIGFAEQTFDEAPFAKQIATHLGTQHTELRVTADDALGVIPRMPEIYDEPFADSSQIPTFLVCQLARRHVTVSLSGDGGDELFGGYRVYPVANSRWQKMRRVPAPLRMAFGSLLGRMPLPVLDCIARASPFRRGRRDEDLADYLHERLPAIGAPALPHYYRAVMSYWSRPDEVVLGATEPDTVASNAREWEPRTDSIGHMMHTDARLYLPDDILVKVDRAGMAVSLETRIPFLDPQVASLAARIPTAIHFKDGRGKWALRQLLERYVPRALFERPKMGFAVPVARWLRGELRPWAEDLLEGASLRREGIFDAALIERRWRRHLAGGVDYSSQLWSVLMFQQWRAHWRQDTNAETRAADAPAGVAARA
jgi:asparagine synthase (glutamine-hydrolysing)